jgi:ferredoxin-nitrite reductase
MGPGTTFSPAIHLNYDTPWERRDLLGVHPQKQPGLCWVGASVPAGRINAQDFEEFAAVAEKYGDGTVRLTCEENILFVNVPEEKVPEMLTEPVFLKFKVNPGEQSIESWGVWGHLAWKEVCIGSDKVPRLMRACSDK